MSTTRVFITNPSATHLEDGDVDWIIAGTRPDIAVNRIDSYRSFSVGKDTITSLPGEYSILRIDNSLEKTAINAHRGITSSFDWYFTLTDRGPVIGDHFREVLAEVPVEERTVAESVGSDQLLLGTRPSKTYVEEVERLGHGESLSWEVNSDDQPEVNLTEGLSTNNHLSPSKAKQKLDSYFSSSLVPDEYDGPATMLSGGVDSTLMQSYLQSPPTVSAAYDSPEFEYEVEYALEASDLLNSEHQLLRFDESDFLSAVEKTTDATGHPLQHLQTTLMRQTVAETPHKTYFNGQLADGIFGVGSAVGYQIAWMTRHFNHYLPSIYSQIDQLKQLSAELKRPVSDEHGAGMQFVIHSDEERVEDIVGETAVRNSKIRRFQYVRDRLSFDDTSGYGPHMHVGHFIDFFQDNTVTPWRHAAHAHGKSLQTPFAAKKVVETVLSVPREKRYTNRFENKYLLKDLLNERLPGYNTKKSKGSSALPEERYLKRGPLSEAFEKYSIPEFVPSASHDKIRTGVDHTSWYALAYAVWRDRILTNPNLGHFESTSILER
ncbi:asparagine synthase C-terminal domain-containing protein [Halorubrum ezzemoulense]|uniref:asparagine synthase-related protein n=1 Tax=Halorubrum ezzemoulense TaxID=337243 RepID=UPI00232E1B90|nr:asparagine synthase C-terminal domain-containing protein [Halorubrum ezzemoulense]MDB2253530.1 asparagine synthase C-terminal domain-containing protein [Halorubrum ezzemoulense]